MLALPGPILTSQRPNGAGTCALSRALRHTCEYQAPSRAHVLAPALPPAQSLASALAQALGPAPTHLFSWPGRWGPTSGSNVVHLLWVSDQRGGQEFCTKPPEVRKPQEGQREWPTSFWCCRPPWGQRSCFGVTQAAALGQCFLAERTQRTTPTAIFGGECIPISVISGSGVR